MAQRQGRHTHFGHRLPVVSHPIRGRPTEGPQRRVHSGDQCGRRPVPRQEHHLVTGPCQPRPEQQGAPTLHPWTLAQSCRPLASSAGRCAGDRLSRPACLLHHPACRAFGAGITQPPQPVVDHVGSDGAPGPLHPPLHLGQIEVDPARPQWPARRQTGPDPTGPRNAPPWDGRSPPDSPSTASIGSNQMLPGSPGSPPLSSVPHVITLGVAVKSKGIRRESQWKRKPGERGEPREI